MTEQLVLDAGGPLGISGEPGRRVYTAAMPVRWSDQDLYHHVKYRGQVKHADGPIRVRMWCEKVGGALMVARHEVRGRHTPDTEPPAVDCTARIAAFDLQTQRPRRFTTAERDYLLEFRHEAES